VTESLEEAYKASQKRLEAVQNLKETEKQIAALTARLGESLESITKRLELKKIELTGLAEFIEALDAKADELDRLETEILALLKRKLELV